MNGRFRPLTWFSFAMLVAPGVANRLFPAILFPSFIGELSLALWLLVKGVNPEKV